jgi:hypothetical protein
MKLLAPLLALCLLLAGATVGRAQGGQSFSLRPASSDPSNPTGGAYFVYTVAPGATRSDEVLVLNTGDEPATLDLYAVDALTGATTGAVYANQGSAPTGAGTWIRLPQARVTVPPQSTARVPFDVNVPAGASPGQHLGGLVAQPAAGDAAQPAGQAVGKGGQFTVTTTTRVVVAVAITVPGPLERKIAVTGVRAQTGASGTQLQVGIRNDGNVLVKPKGRLILRDASAAERLQAPLDMDTILPGGAAEYAVPWPRELPGGDYTAEVVLDATDALPGTAPAAAPGPGAGAAARAGHAEFRSQPIPVEPSASPVPTAAPAAAAPAPASAGVGGLNVERSWLLIGLGALVALLLANAAIVTYVLRRRRSDLGPDVAFAAPPAAPRIAPTPPANVPPPAGPPTESAFVKGRGRTIYLLEGGARRPFASWAAFIARGGSPTLSNVRLLADDALAAIPEGTLIEDAPPPPHRPTPDAGARRTARRPGRGGSVD